MSVHTIFYNGKMNEMSPFLVEKSNSTGARKSISFTRPPDKSV